MTDITIQFSINPLLLTFLVSMFGLLFPVSFVLGTRHEPSGYGPNSVEGLFVCIGFFCVVLALAAVVGGFLVGAGIV